MSDTISGELLIITLVEYINKLLRLEKPAFRLALARLSAQEKTG